ncbi:MAG: IPT/TIG domain-containing protein [Candidatus Xenobia bacterium]
MRDLVLALLLAFLLPGCRVAPGARAAPTHLPTRSPAAVAPVVDGFKPESGVPGDHVVIVGKGFGASPDVVIQGVHARVLRATDAEIVAVVPASTTAKIEVHVGKHVGWSRHPFIYSLGTVNGKLEAIPVGGGRWFPSHTFTIRVDKGMVGNPFEEWRSSHFARDGVSCPGCHMPERRHMWRGIHDPAMTRSGLDISLTVSSTAGGLALARATITSIHVGHRFPTYPIPMVHIRLFRRSASGLSPLGQEYVIGRDVDLHVFKELFDHRLAPGESHFEARTFKPHPGDRVVLHIDVVPRNDYERKLRRQVDQAAARGDVATVNRAARHLKQEMAFRYRLVDAELQVPPPGQTRLWRMPHP